MSTAYVAGNTSGLCMEKEVLQNDFHNPYEESKKKAEDALVSLCGERDIPLTIFRPSITYGESTTGKASGSMPSTIGEGAALHKGHNAA